MDITRIYEHNIHHIYKSLIASGKNKDTIDNHDLCKIFEYYTCIQLSKQYNQTFYEYDDIHPTFKEDNDMSRYDTGIDACNLTDTIVQCKLRKNNLSWNECATFFGSQNTYDTNNNATVIRWPKLIISRNKECKLSHNLINKQKMFTDVAYQRDDVINYCNNLLENPPKAITENKTKFKLRDYQLEAIDIINKNTNVIISLPTGCGKNIVIIHSMADGKRYLILVPRIILMEQIYNEIIKHKPKLKNNIQVIGDNNNEYDSTKNITICVYNSISTIEQYCGTFDKIYVDEAHHIHTPEIYKNYDDDYDTTVKENKKTTKKVITDNDDNDDIDNDIDHDSKEAMKKQNKKTTKKVITDDNDIGNDSKGTIKKQNKKTTKKVITDDDNDIGNDSKETVKKQNKKTTKKVITDDDEINIKDTMKKNNKKTTKKVITDEDSYDEDCEEDSYGEDYEEDYDNSDDSDDDYYDDNSNSDNNSDDDNRDSIDDSEDEIKNTSGYKKIINSLTKYNNCVYLSATIDKIDGFEFYGKDIRDMIEQKYLCDYTIHVPIFSNDPSNKNICEHLVKNYRHTIIYCDSQKEGKKINELLNTIKNKCSEYIDCNTSKRNRNMILKRYKDEYADFLVNVRILMEGFDAPITQNVCFLHMPSNKTATIQIIGRALRLHPMKTFANVILPYSCDEDNKNISKFLSTLADNDKVIKQKYFSKKIGGYIQLEKTDNKKKENDNDNDTDNNVEFRYNMIYNSIGIMQNNVEIWMNKLDKCKSYIDKFKMRPSQKSKDAITRQLGKWISHQMQNSKSRTCAMKNDDIFDAWNAFINDANYAKYFK